HRVGTPDPLVRARSIAHQGPSHRRREGRHAARPRRRSRRVHRREPQAGRVMSEKHEPPKGPEGPDENQIIAERRARLAELRRPDAAFQNDFRREHLAADLHAAWGGKSNEELEPANIAVSIAGRVMLKRVMGKASFATVQDMSARIQLYVTRDGVGEAAYE